MLAQTAACARRPKPCASAYDPRRWTLTLAGGDRTAAGGAAMTTAAIRAPRALLAPRAKQVVGAAVTLAIGRLLHLHHMIGGQ